MDEGEGERGILTARREATLITLGQWPKKATQPMMVRNFPWFGLVGKRKRRRLFPHVRVAKEEELRKNFPEKARKKEGNKLGA